jgi:hypothetical protein
MANRFLWVRAFLLYWYLLISGCATHPIAYSEITVVPNSRVLAPEFLAERSGTAKITIKRDAGFMGSACTYKVFIDGRPLARIHNGERINFFVDPGQHILGALAEGFCGGGTAEVEASLTTGQWKNYRIASGQDGTLQLLATAF